MKIEVSEGQEFEVITGKLLAFHRETEVFCQNMIHLFAIL